MLDTLPASPSAPAIIGRAVEMRAFAAKDAPKVADLLVRAFQHVETPAPQGMADYLRAVYLDAPWFDAEIASRVTIAPDGAIIGFAGVIAQTMRLDGAPIRAAFTSSLAVDPRLGDPTIAARLLRDVRSGPQDAVLSDRSNARALGLMRSLGAEDFPDYSLDWLRILRPAGFALAGISRRFGPLRLAAPLLRPFDNAALAKIPGNDDANWTPYAPSRGAAGFSRRAAGLNEIAALIPPLLDRFGLRPDWSPADLATILADGARKDSLGAFSAELVIAPNGDVAGLFMMHARRDAAAHVLDMLAEGGREGIVLDHAIAHALDLGAVAIRGRAKPWFKRPLMEQRAVLLPKLWTNVQSRNETVLRRFRENAAFFTGLAGENWMRLNGDSF